MRNILRFVLFALALASASAAPFTNLYFFGDSLSDSGNISALTAGLYPSAPYYQGRFSSGPVWAETLSVLEGLPNAGQHAGMTLGPNFLNLHINGPGDNYAIGGARTDTTGAIDSLGIPTGVLTQVSYYLSTSAASPDALYVLFGGGNDLRDASLLPASQRDLKAVQAAFNVVTAAYVLGLNGARRFLIMNAPDIGLTPEARLERNNAASATAATLQYNLALDYFMNAIVFPNQQLFRYDTFTTFNLLYQDALNGGAFSGITNATTPCFAGFAGSTGANCATSLFADDIHPTGLTHSLLALGVYSAVNRPQTAALGDSSVPEPATFVLMGGALAALLWHRRQRKSKTESTP